jgi:hypothetical protein
MEAALQQIENMRDRISHEQNEERRFGLLTHGVASLIRTYIQNQDNQAITSLSTFLDSRTPELYAAYCAHRGAGQTQGAQTQGAGGETQGSGLAQSAGNAHQG